MFDSEQRNVLLSLARNAIVSYLDNTSIITAPSHDFLKIPSAAFVTLKNNLELRGCIGSLEPSGSLGETIIHCAVSAAFRDPRFPPLTRQEYPLIHLEISVLSEFVRAVGAQDVVAGVHGVLITNQNRRGLLLPQVATEYGWDPETFLTYACRKAGLHDSAWRDTATTIEIFTAEVFGERD